MYYLTIMHCIFLFQVIYIYIYPFLLYFLFSFVFGTCGLRYSIPPIHSDFVSLRRYHFLPLFFIAIETLRTMFTLVGGRVEKGSFVLMLSYFCNLVDFCLIFKISKSFLNYSLWLLKIISQK